MAHAERISRVEDTSNTPARSRDRARDILRTDLQKRLGLVMQADMTALARTYAPAEIEQMIRLNEAGQVWLAELILIAGQDCRRMAKEIQASAEPGSHMLSAFDDFFDSMEIAGKEHLAMRWLTAPDVVREWLERCARQRTLKRDLAHQLGTPDINPFDDASSADIIAVIRQDSDFAVEIMTAASADSERLARTVELGYVTRDVRGLFIESFRNLNESEQLHFAVLWLKDPSTTQHAIETLAALDYQLAGFRDEVRAAATATGLTEADVGLVIRKVGLLHDLGKLRVPDRVLFDDTPRGATPHVPSVGDMLRATATRHHERDGSARVARTLTAHGISPDISFRSALEHQGASAEFVAQAAGWQHETVGCLCGHHHPRSGDMAEVPEPWRALLHVVRLADHQTAVGQDRPYKSAKPIETVWTWMAKDYAAVSDRENTLTIRWMTNALASLPPARRLRVASAVGTKLTESIITTRVTDPVTTDDLPAALDMRRHLRAVQEVMVLDATMTTQLLAAQDVTVARAALAAVRDHTVRDIPTPRRLPTGAGAAREFLAARERTERMTRTGRSFAPDAIARDLSETDIERIA